MEGFFMSKYQQIVDLVGQNKPKPVKSADLQRAENLVRTVEKLELLKAELAAEVETLILPIKAEIKSHKRMVEKMFNTVLPPTKPRTKQTSGLKNWQEYYLKSWKDAGLVNQATSSEQLRKCVGVYNKVQFKKRLDQLVELEQVKKNELGKFIVVENGGDK